MVTLLRPEAECLNISTSKVKSGVIIIIQAWIKTKDSGTPIFGLNQFKSENVFYFALEVTFRLNYEKSFIKNQLVLAVLEKIKSCGRWWGNDLVVMTAF